MCLVVGFVDWKGAQPMSPTAKSSEQTRWQPWQERLIVWVTILVIFVGLMLLARIFFVLIPDGNSQQFHIPQSAAVAAFS